MERFEGEMPRVQKGMAVPQQTEIQTLESETECF